MKRTFWYQITVLLLLILSIDKVYSVPAPKKIIEINQPDGKSFRGRIIGDEFFHYVKSEDNYILLPDKNGFLKYAEKDAEGNLIPGKYISRNIVERTAEETNYLNKLSKDQSFSEKQLKKPLENRLAKSVIKKDSRTNLTRSANSEVTENKFPNTGIVKSLVILVDFKDLKFKVEKPGIFFSDLFNKEGFNYDNHIGSVRDYFMFNSRDKFKPEFSVYGPVTLDNDVSYYGSNNNNGEDSHPAQMVYEACLKLASTIDFSQYDSNNDGYVDNIFVCYAGMGENDGGAETSIWPHAWVLSGESLELTLNGKKIEDYGCSPEFQGNDAITGIGVFCHEFSHLLGLMDSYDIDYETNGEGFDLGDWSLMAQGSYNCNENVPPALTLIERQMLGWSTPLELNVTGENIRLPQLDTFNLGYIIRTNNPNEYFLLENRQNKAGSWDEYIPYHGMLIYHIDKRTDAGIKLMYNNQERTFTFSDLWELNMINAVSSHQCMDVEEADNKYIINIGYNRSEYINDCKGDPFPGKNNITTFSDYTSPSMKTWSGESLLKSITNIKEKNSTISFDFSNLISFENRKPTIIQASNTGPFSFVLEWNEMPEAIGYYVDVFRLDFNNTGGIDTILLDSYNNYYNKDTTLRILELDDLSFYICRVKGTNGTDLSLYSNYLNLRTIDAPEVIAFVRNRTIYLKGIDKSTISKLYNLSGILVSSSDTNEFKVEKPGVYIAEFYHDGFRQIQKILVK
jgi:M6 family metalloprotease-like protein